MRSPHPTDGRQTNVAPTAKRAASRQSISDAKRKWLAQAFARLDAEDRKALFAAEKIARKLMGKGGQGEERAALRRAVARGRPYGDDHWSQRTARAMGTESSVRPIGRPKKAKSRKAG
jgi:hypothetical protein